ncbi:unnamed protein product [Ranitomeya imitator]|uniref:peptidylprolyl isomerase n=1 Tax=Ranitomeya imitator TaxID=111125 RepID=A0ABN9M4I7_9NEOB|nr:unnamed protein product [Ranitomeya imitator]
MNFMALCAGNYYTAAYSTATSRASWCRRETPQGTGKGGQSIWGRKFEDEFSEFVSTASAASSPWQTAAPIPTPRSFFITYGKQPHLDMKYTILGKVIDGLDTLDELEKLPVHEKSFRPLEEVRIKDVTIHANPFAL